jgi:hypothetical protein
MSSASFLADTSFHEPGDIRLQEAQMDPLMNEERLGTQSPAHAVVDAHAAEYLEMGFIPSWFDFGTQTLHPSCWSPLLIPGFERNGYFYTRTAAARAMADWRGTY